MLEEGGEASEIITTILRPISGNNLIQAFTTKNFSFLDEKHKDLREALLEVLENHTRSEVIEDISESISSLLVPTELPTQGNLHIANLQRCQ